MSQKVGIKDVGKLADALTRVINQKQSAFAKDEKEEIRKIRDALNRLLAKKLGGRDDEISGLQNADKSSDRKKDRTTGNRDNSSR